MSASEPDRTNLPSIPNFWKVPVRRDVDASGPGRHAFVAADGTRLVVDASIATVGKTKEDEFESIYRASSWQGDGPWDGGFVATVFERSSAVLVARDDGPSALLALRKGVRVSPYEADPSFYFAPASDHAAPHRTELTYELDLVEATSDDTYPDDYGDGADPRVPYVS